MTIKWELEIIRFISIAMNLRKFEITFNLLADFFRFDIFLIGITAISFLMSAAHLTMYIERKFTQVSFVISSILVLLLSAMIGNVIYVGSCIAGILALIAIIRMRRSRYML